MQEYDSLPNEQIARTRKVQFGNPLLRLGVKNYSVGGFLFHNILGNADKVFFRVGSNELAAAHGRRILLGGKKASGGFSRDGARHTLILWLSCWGKQTSCCPGQVCWVVRWEARNECTKQA